MSEQRAGSRLPDDARYWDDLAARSIDAALGPARPRVAAARAAWWSGLSDASYVLAASALLAVIGGSLLLDERPRAGAAADARALAESLGPVDPLLGSLLAASVEPPASALLTLVALREEAR